MNNKTVIEHFKGLYLREFNNSDVQSQLNNLFW